MEKGISPSTSIARIVEQTGSYDPAAPASDLPFWAPGFVLTPLPFARNTWATIFNKASARLINNLFAS
jgi:hypothetical protein